MEIIMKNKILSSFVILAANIIIIASIASAQGKEKNDDSLYRGQESIEEALRFIGEPNEKIKKLTIPFKGKLANEKQLAIAAKLIDIHTRRDVEEFKLLLCTSNLKDMEDPENRLNKIAEDIKKGQFLTSEEGVKFFATSRPFPADEFRSKNIYFSEEPNEMLILYYYHKPKKMLIGSTFYLLQSADSYKITFSNHRYQSEQQKEPNSVGKTGENQLVTAPEMWTRVLPDGNAIKLVAIFDPEKPDVFWNPDGEIIKGPKLSAAQLANAEGSKLAVVFEVPKETEGQKPAADEKFYSVYGWGEIEPNKPLTASYGRGWGKWETIISRIYEGRALPYQNQYYTLAKVEDKSSGEQKRILITMWYSANTDFGIRLVAVDRKGNKYPAEADDIWIGMPPKGVRAKYYKLANGLSKNELDHFEIQRRPMAWAVFTDFATSPKTTEVQTEKKQ